MRTQQSASWPWKGTKGEAMKSRAKSKGKALGSLGHRTGRFFSIYLFISFDCSKNPLAHNLRGRRRSLRIGRYFEPLFLFSFWARTPARRQETPRAKGDERRARGMDGLYCIGRLFPAEALYYFLSLSLGNDKAWEDGASQKEQGGRKTFLVFLDVKRD